MKTLAYCLSKAGKALSEERRQELLSHVKAGMTEQEAIQTVSSAIRAARRQVVQAIVPNQKVKQLTPRQALIGQLRGMIVTGQHAKYKSFGDMAEEAKVLAHDAAIKMGWTPEKAQEIKAVDVAKLKEARAGFNKGEASFAIDISTPSGLSRGWPNSRHYSNTIPDGYIDFEVKDDGSLIIHDAWLERGARGKGTGQKLVKEILDANPDATVWTAATSEGMEGVAKALGFKKVAKKGAPEDVHYGNATVWRKDPTPRASFAREWTAEMQKGEVRNGLRYDGPWEGVGHTWTVIEGKVKTTFTTKTTKASEVWQARSKKQYDLADKVQEITKMVGRVGEGLKNGPAEIRVLGNLEGMKPEHLAELDAQEPGWRQAYEAGETKGSLTGDGTTVYLFAQNLLGVREAESVLLQEAIGHYGTRGLFGGRMNPLLDRVWLLTGGSQAMKQQILPAYFITKEQKANGESGIVFDPSNPAHRRRAADEYIAHIATKETLTEGEQSLWDKVVDWFNELLTKIGLHAFNERDLRAIIRSAKKFVEGEGLVTKGNALEKITGTSFAQRTPAPWWYSTLLNAVSDANFPAKLQSIPNYLAKKGVTKEEVEWLGLAQWLKDHSSNGRVDRQALRDFVQQNQVRVEKIVRSEANTTPDALSTVKTAERLIANEGAGEIVHFLRESPDGPEMMLQYFSPDVAKDILDKLDNSVVDGQMLADALPPELIGEIAQAYGMTARDITGRHPRYQQHFSDVPGAKAGTYTELQITVPGAKNPTLVTGYDLEDETPTSSRDEYAYRGAHWDEGDVAVHVIFDERVDAGGKRTLYVIELQSDWAQDYSKKRDVPKGPFMHNAMELGVKATIRWAAEHGFDKVAFAHEETLIKRWGSDQYMWRRVKPINVQQMVDMHIKEQSERIDRLNPEMVNDLKQIKEKENYLINEVAAFLEEKFKFRISGQNSQEKIDKGLKDAGFNQGEMTVREYNNAVSRLGGRNHFFVYTIKERDLNGRLEEVSPQFETKKEAADWAIGYAQKENDKGYWEVSTRTQFGGHAAGFDLQAEAERLAAEGRFEQSRSAKVATREDARKIVEQTYRPEEYKPEYIERKTDQLWSAIQKNPESGALLPRKIGMEVSYGQVLPNYLRKFVKQWGATVEEGKIGAKDDSGRYEIWEDDSDPSIDPMWEVHDKETGQTVDRFPHTEDGRRQAQALINTLKKEGSQQEKEGLPAYTIALNEQMKETAIYQGFASFKIERVPKNLEHLGGREERTIGSTISAVYNNIKTKEFRDRVKWKVFDKVGPVKTLIGDVPYKLLRMENGSSMSFQTMMRHGMLEWDNRSQVYTVNTAKQGFVPWLHTLGPDVNKFLWWSMARRAENLEAQGRENWLTAQERTEIYKWAGPRDKAEWLQKAKELDAWNKSVLDLAERAGLIDPATRGQWEQEFYVPFYRLKEDADLWHQFLTAPQKSKKFISSGIRELVGGDFKLGDPLENLLKNWMHLIQESMRNVARKTTAEWAQTTNPDAIKELEFKDINVFRTGKGTNKRMTYVTKKDQRNVLVYQRDGAPVYIKVEDPDIFNAMSGVDANVLDGVLAKALSVPKRTLTVWATISPAFKVANLMRDTMHTALIEQSFNPITDAVKGIRKVWKQDMDYLRLQAAGGTFGTSYLRGRDAEEAAKGVKGILRREQGGVVFKSLSQVWDWWERVGEASENAARVMVYANKTRKGANSLDAAFDARDLLDFMSHGGSSAVQFLIHTIPFLNARMQGLYKLGATAANPNTRGNLLFRGALMTVASLALWAVYKDDDRYKELEEYDKMTYFHWWVGNLHFRMPKPFEVGAFFASIPEAFANYTNGTEDGKHVWRVIGKTISDTISLDVPQAIKPIMEQWANKSFFTDRPIVGEHLQGLVPGEQADPWTPESAKLAGKTLGVSPNRIKALTEGYLAVLGTMILAGTDAVMKTVGDYPDEAETRIDDMPLIGRFVKEAENPRYTRYQSKFYEMFDEYDKIAKTMTYYKGMGEPQKAMAMAEENRPLLSVGKDMEGVKEKLRKVRANMRVIANSSLSSEEKTQRLDAFIEQRNRLVKEAYLRASAKYQALKGE